MSVDQNTFDDEIERKKAQIKYDSDYKIEAFKAAIQYGLNTSRAIFILNGGAILSLLTFWGNVKGRLGLDPVWMVSSLGLFIVGLIFGTACTAAAYWSQGHFSHLTKEGDLAGKKYQLLSLICGSVGIAFFVVGAIFAAISLAKAFDAVCP